MNNYSVKDNLLAIWWVYSRPNKLINTITSMPIAYGVVAFLLYLIVAESAWLQAWAAGSYESLSPLPKLFPIVDADYPLYMAVLGPIIKVLGVFVFIGVFLVISQSNVLDYQAYRALINLYLLVGSSLSIVVIVVDRLIMHGGAAHLIMSLVHPMVVILTTVYLVNFVGKQINYTFRRALVTVVPAVLLSWLLPALLFR